MSHTVSPRLKRFKNIGKEVIIYMMIILGCYDKIDAKIFPILKNINTIRRCDSYEQEDIIQRRMGICKIGLKRGEL